MIKNTMKQATVGSKKAAETSVGNDELSQPEVKRTNFHLVAVGTCPHCQGLLGSDIASKGIGVTRVCEKC